MSQKIMTEQLVALINLIREQVSLIEQEDIRTEIFSKISDLENVLNQVA